MKKRACMLLCAAMIGTAIGALAENAALDAFAQLTGKTIAASESIKLSETLLDEAMAGDYLVEIADEILARQLASSLSGLTRVTTKDIATYAQAKGLAVGQVKNAYYRSLANVLNAEIMVNPAQEERYRNIQIILSLFLEHEETENAAATRSAIRSSMNEASARTLAEGYNLPTGFVQFIVMNDNWEDDSWENDDDWAADAGWYYQSTEDTAQADTPDYDTPKTEKPAATLAPQRDTPETSDYDTPQYSAPKKNDTPDTPDGDTPDYEDS